MFINASSEAKPLEGVFIRTDYWSSLTGTDGNTFLPFGADENDYAYVIAGKKGYIDQSGWQQLDCAS
jgi:hypothetical protein